MIHDKVRTHNIYFITHASVPFKSPLISTFLQVVAYLPAEMQEALAKPTKSMPKTSIKRNAEADEEKRSVKNKI